MKRLGIDFEVVDYVEIDKFPCKSYNAINGTSFEPQDIAQWDKDLDVDFIMHGSPCQDFSVAGLGKGGDEGSGTRSSLMFETVRIVEKLKPKFVLWENVKNVMAEKNIHNFKAYLAKMEDLGYHNYHKILNAKDFGVPQNRERIFVLSCLEEINYEFPKGFESDKCLRDILEEEVDEKFYLEAEKVVKLIEQMQQSGKLWKLADDCNVKVLDDTFSEQFGNLRVYDNAPTLRGSRYGLKIIECRAILTPDKLNKRQNGRRAKEDGEPMFTITAQDRHGVYLVYQLPRGKNTGGLHDISPTVTSNCFECNNLLVEYCYYVLIRKLTPKECWRLMGFDDDVFDLAASVNSNSQLYKQAGNSIVVNVLCEILKGLEL